MKEAKEASLRRDTSRMTADQILANTSPTSAYHIPANMRICMRSYRGVEC